MAGILKEKWEYRYYGIESNRKMDNEIQQSIKNDRYPIVTDISKIAEDEHWYTTDEQVEMDKNAKKGLYPCCIVYSNKDLREFANNYHSFVRNLSKRSSVNYPFKLDKISSDTHTKYIFYANDELRKVLEESQYSIFSRSLTRCIKSMGTIYDVFIAEGENLYLFESSDPYKNFYHQYTPLTTENASHALWLEALCKSNRSRRAHNESEKSTKARYPMKQSPYVQTSKLSQEEQKAYKAQQVKRMTRKNWHYREVEKNREHMTKLFTINDEMEMQQ